MIVRQALNKNDIYEIYAESYDEIRNAYKSQNYIYQIRKHELETWG